MRVIRMGCPFVLYANNFAIKAYLIILTTFALLTGNLVELAPFVLRIE